MVGTIAQSPCPAAAESIAGSFRPSLETVIPPSSLRRRGSLAKPSFAKICGDRRRADRLAIASEGAADVVDGQVLLAQCKAIG
jgi:hypothetical protein